MVAIAKKKVAAFFHEGDIATTTKAKGDALEEAICYVFGQVPGVAVTSRNRKNPAGTEEIDIGFWNDRTSTGFSFHPSLLLVECKNWSVSVGSEQVSWFDAKLRSRSLKVGFLVASAGVTGDMENKREAYSIIARALTEGRRITVITRTELLKLRSTAELVKLVKEKLCKLVFEGAFP